MSKGRAFPHEKRLQRFAYVALVVATLLALVGVRQGHARLFGVALPPAALLALALAGGVAGAAAVARRSTPWALAGVLLLVLALVPAGLVDPGILGYAVALALAIALLAYGELVHMMTRYEAAHRAVEEDGLPEAHLDKVTDEALATLAGRLGLTLALAGAGVGLAYAFRFVGPAQWRAALETTAPLGVALASLALLATGAILILFRGARLPWRRQPENQETAPDVAD